MPTHGTAFCYSLKLSRYCFSVFQCFYCHHLVIIAHVFTPNLACAVWSLVISITVIMVAVYAYNYNIIVGDLYLGVAVMYSHHSSSFQF